jgi:hypothetical protein
MNIVYVSGSGNLFYGNLRTEKKIPYLGFKATVSNSCGNDSYLFSYLTWAVCFLNRIIFVKISLFHSPH